MKPLKFKCPQCGHDHLDEVVVGMAVYHEIEAVWPDHLVEYGAKEEGEDQCRVPSVRFQCQKCEYVLIDNLGWRVDARSGLVDWINFNCTFSVETIREKLDVSPAQAQDIRAIIFDLEPLQHEGKSISTAERYLLDLGFDHSVAGDEVALVLVAAKAAMTGTSNSCGGPKRTSDGTVLLTVCHPIHGYNLGYHTEGKYYFWVTLSELTQLEEQWKNKS